MLQKVVGEGENSPRKIQGLKGAFYVYVCAQKLGEGEEAPQGSTWFQYVWSHSYKLVHNRQGNHQESNKVRYIDGIP